MYKKYLLVISSFLAFSSSFAQSTLVNNGGQFVIALGTEIHTNDTEIVNENGGTIHNDGSIFLEKDWMQTGMGSTYSGNGLIWFGGNADQSLVSDSDFKLSKLIVDNGNRLILGSNLEIVNEVDLMFNGNIELGAKNLILSSEASLYNYNDHNYIITNSTGTLEQEVGRMEVVFPLGNSSYNPVILSNTGEVDEFQIRVEDQVTNQDLNQLGNMVNRTWLINEKVEGGSDLDIEFQWSVDQEMSNFDRTKSQILQLGQSQNEQITQKQATLQISNNWSQKLEGLNQFSSFNIMSKQDISNLNILDKSIEKDQLISSLSEHEEGLTDINVFPNPTAGVLNLGFENLPTSNVIIQIYSINGQLIFENQESNIKDGIISLEETTQLPSGTYLVQVILENGEQFSKRFIRSK